jgi:predicted phosphate transport protein (TIGR00153 family)
MTVGNSLGKLLGRSPLSPLQEHMRTAAAAVAKLGPLVAAAQAGDWKQAASRHKQILALARDGDRMKLELRMQLRKSLFMPVSRTDLLELLSAQDLIADHAETFANLLMSRQIQVPGKAEQAFRAYLAEVEGAAQFALEAVNELDEVFEVGFGKREIDEVFKQLRALARREKSARKLEAKLRHRLFTLESSMDPLDAMFLYQLVDRLDQIGRGSEHIGNRLLILISV